jgi:hypothetical protein
MVTILVLSAHDMRAVYANLRTANECSTTVLIQARQPSFTGEGRHGPRHGCTALMRVISPQVLRARCRPCGAMRRCATREVSCLAYSHSPDQRHRLYVLGQIATLDRLWTLIDSHFDTNPFSVPQEAVFIEVLDISSAMVRGLTSTANRLSRRGSGVGIERVDVALEA